MTRTRATSPRFAGRRVRYTHRTVVTLTWLAFMSGGVIGYVGGRWVAPTGVRP